MHNNNHINYKYSLILDVILMKLQALRTIYISASMTTNTKHKEILITHVIPLNSDS